MTDDFLVNIATQEDWRAARELIDSAKLRFYLAAKVAQESGIRLNYSHIARTLKVDRRRVSEWHQGLLQSLSARNAACKTPGHDETAGNPSRNSVSH